jgi:hypothetical protein
MSPEAQRIAIAEACGFTDVRMEEWENVDIESRSIAYGTELQGTLNGERKFVPDYLNDLDAMHEAEGSLSDPAKRTYINALVLVVNESEWSKWPTAHATAAQRAEAFLRTLNLWVDAPEQS